ncbi:MAG: glucosamine-6-phosphate deaminase [Phycisphaerae bacterium]
MTLATSEQPAGISRTCVFRDPHEVSAAVARQIAELVRAKQAAGETCVLGLATGSTPTGVYAELIRMHRNEGLSFGNVVTFNLDEYWPMRPDSLQSYRRFMDEHLFDHIDIDKANTHVPDGTLALEAVGPFCAAYEQQIVDAGGLDLQLLGIGRTGHVGFNEPGSGRDSRTRLIWLDRLTRLDAASDFFGIENVPLRAITMGVGTILAARRVVLVAFGENKAPIIREAIEGPVTPTVAASFLQEHAQASFYLDAAAAAELSWIKTPWLHGEVAWDEAMIRRAAIWLGRKVGKPLLKLTDEHYNEHGLQSLVAERGPVYNVNLQVFRAMQRTITGWPGGKPSEEKLPGDIDRPADEVFPKRVVIFSPHPDDDVISMGGTLIRLVDQGHDVHVAYQTSGNIAVFDEDCIRFADFAADFNRMFGIDQKAATEIEQHIEQFLKNKQPGMIDSGEVQQLKGLIRRGEARAACRSCGLGEASLHFLDLPFYETGKVRKKPLGQEDIDITVDLLRQIKPHQVYAAGDLSDPHGTHRTCLAAIVEALKVVEQDGWYRQCEVWLYRGAWQEWEPHQIEMAVPLSPEEVDRKRVAIFKHESQKDKALFPGTDEREFWKRAEDRNRDTARLYDQLGLAEYEAIEGFVRWSTVDAMTALGTGKQP